MATADAARRRRFEAVVDDVYEPLQRYLGRRLPAQDVSEVLNDTLLVLWRRLDAVPADDPLPWSYGVARRCLANVRRGERRRLRLASRLVDECREAWSSMAPRSGSDTHPALSRALRDLGEADQELLRLWAWEQLEPREIAVVLDTTPNAVSLRLTRAKKKLAASIQRQDREAGGQERFGYTGEPRS